MNDQSTPPASLEQVRRQIDEIDARLIELLRERFSASEAVKAVKAATGQDSASPIRPAREAIVMRRLIDACQGPLPTDLMVRLWREIITSSTLVQADASVHCTIAVMQAGRLRDLIRSHFGRIPVVEHGDDDAALKAAAHSRTAVAVTAPDGDSARFLSDGDIAQNAVIGTLPAFNADGVPQLLIIGQPFEEPTGQDETLVLTSGRLPRDFSPAPLWAVELPSGDTLTSLPGFLSSSQTPLLDLRQRNENLALRVLGRYPSPIRTDK
ncbi:MAG: hypothetical protein HKN11_00680 [Rhizobiales bacterium]|nr:hypothetical protein [Hyphomicrobiales bacterium]